MSAVPTGFNGARRKPGDVILGMLTVFTYLFLYFPLVVVVLYSFSETKVNRWPISGYTISWYRELLDDAQIHDALKLSIKVGVLSALIAVVLGTLAALALDRYRFPGKPFLRFLVVLPIVLPGIVTGVAMLAYFTLLGWQLSQWTLVIGHATFATTLVLNNVVARLSQLPRNLDEASADLGATPWRTFWRITFPLVRPAILAGGVLAFTLSFDEIIVSFFLKGRQNTLPLLIWGRLRQGYTPEINAIATAIIVVSLITVVASSLLLRRPASR
jgi:spermidine/putrescine transport system permease protein